MASNRGPEKTPFWQSQVRRPSNTPGSTRGPAASSRPRRPATPGAPQAGTEPNPAGGPAPRPRPRPFTPGSYSASPDGTRNPRPRPFGRTDAPRPYGSTRPSGTGDRPYRPARPAAGPGRPYRPEAPARPRPQADTRTEGPRKPFRPGPPFGTSKPRSTPIPASETRAPRPGLKPRAIPVRKPRPDFTNPRPGSPEAELFPEPQEARREPTPPRPDRIEPDPDTTAEALPTAYLKPGEADRVLSGHPWIYESSVLRLTRQPEDGGVVQVKDHRRRLLGVGFYNAKSKIRVRVLASGRTDLEEAFLEQRIQAALEHRRRFLPEASSFRLVNAEGDLLSGLIVDKYEDVLVLQTSSAGMDRRKAAIVRILERLLQPRAIVERNDMGARKFEGLPEANGVLSGTLSDSELAALPLRLNGLSFEANLRAGHKTGLYLDQQVNHGLVARFARGARVLDAFTFLGGFALTAARAGASSVLGLDQSEDAIQTARRLAEANGLASTCSFEAANVFDWLRTRTGVGQEPHVSPDAAETPAPFDLIILDPPSFTRNRASVGDALRGYKEIHLRALKLLGPGGILATFCCSHHVDALLFEGVIREAAFDARRQLRRIEAYTQSPDHPILPAVPETEYLKGYAFEVLAP